MKVGVILVGYNMEEYVQRCLRAWTDARATKLGGHEFVICAVSLPFAGFPITEEDETTFLLDDYAADGKIDWVISQPRNIPETTARGMALQYLKGAGCDITWMVDLDEFYTTAYIQAILSFVEVNPFVAWFRLSLANYVFDEHTRLVDPFTPPRIHRMRVDGYQAHSFSADNDIAYGGTITRDIIPQDRFPSLTIPESIASIKHLTWLNDTSENKARSKAKIRYQLETRNWPTCSFAWDDTQGGLIFNPALPAPKVVRES